MTDDGYHALRESLAAGLLADGDLRPGPWHEAFVAVPRHPFLLRFFRQTPDLARWEAVDHAYPEWAAMVYQNATWVTQLDDDLERWHTAQTEGSVSGTPTSSSTAPGLMALMLEALDPRDGHSVLEIGTGTGYNAALLSHRLGSAAVTTLDVDPALTCAAAHALGGTGHHPTVVTSDGTAGHPRRAPYDRIIATCSLPTVPRAWIDQTRPGGRILVSLGRSLDVGALSLLTVHADGSATGPFLPQYGSFMPARSTRTQPGRLDTALQQRGETRATSLVYDLDAPWMFSAALLLPGLTWTGFTPADTGLHQDWLLAPDGSWAAHTSATGTVEEHGPRHLWDELEHHHHTWTTHGRPTRENLGLTITPHDRHHLWTANPDNVITALPAPVTAH